MGRGRWEVGGGRWEVGGRRKEAGGGRRPAGGGRREVGGGSIVETAMVYVYSPYFGPHDASRKTNNNESKRPKRLNPNTRLL